MNTGTLGEEIYRTALKCGFDDCGIVLLDALEGFEELLDKRMRDVP